MDCFGDDRDALNDFAKYFNNSHLSDVTLIVGEEIYFAHKLILCRSSDVFERMLSQKWNGNKKEIILTEEPHCQEVFHHFLRFLYCNHMTLNAELALPILVLADKYNTNQLKKVCVEYAVNYILPDLNLKELFHTWFNYSIKLFHKPLVKVCITELARKFAEIISSTEWENDWLGIDRDQLIEFLKCNNLVVSSEFSIWEAVQKWLKAPSHSERRGNTSSPLLVQILPLIRFPFMTADELVQVENSVTSLQHPKIVIPYTHAAYKFISLPLASRSDNKDFTGTQFIMRRYTGTRWEKKFTLTNEQLFERNCDHTFNFMTRSNSFASPTWEWTFTFHILSQNTFSMDDEMKITLTATDVDLSSNSRSLEYLLMVHDETKIIRTVFGTKTFTKSRYPTELDLQNKLKLREILSEDSPLLVDKDLNVQLILRPIV